MMKFEDIYTLYWQKVYRICMGYVNDHDWAKDITQETFISIFKQLSGFRNEASIETWIYRIASNHCLRQIENKEKVPKASLTTEIYGELESDLQEKSAFLYKCISELPEIDRIIISLELENVKQSEIASIMGLSEANVRVKLFRIRKTLTQKFSRYEQ